MMQVPTRVRRCHVYSADPEQAAAELYQQLWQPDCTLVLLFVAPDYALDNLATALRHHFGDITIVGCTTAGEISPDGYRYHSIAGISLAAPDFYTEIKHLAALSDFDLSDALGVVMSARYALGQKAGFAIERRTFALLLVDGLSAREEQLAGSLARALGDIPICGGSAGDNMRFERTHILIGGQFVSDSAALLLIASRHPFEVFKSEHTIRNGERLVVTEADSQRRLVTEINAEPAAAEYARLLGVVPEKLSPLAFAAHPLVLNVGGVPYVRSIQRINPDLSLSFFCAVDEGIVLSGTRALDIVDNLAHTFAALRQRLGDFQLVLGFDCILRTLPLQQHGGALARLSRLLAANAVVGFSTYGEQYQAMHVNQTFTGVAIGYAQDHD